jgi:predicted kinase
MMNARQFLNAIDLNSKPRVYLMCGIAGAGKTTLANKLVEKGFIRLSIDEYIWAQFGKYNIDYHPGQYPELQKEAEYQLEQELITYLKQKQSLVIDYSFWKRSNREKYKALIESYGVECIILFFKVDYEILKSRLKNRSSRFDANAAFPITDEILDQYYTGFQEPVNEGEIIILPD